MERIGGEGTEMSTSIRKVVVASFIGTTFEWYDYFIFATASALFFPAVFFPGFGETTGTILAYTTFLVGTKYTVLIVLAAVIGLAEETFQKDIYEEEPEERRLVAEQHV